VGAVFVEAAVSCATAMLAQHNNTTATVIHNWTSMPCDFMNLDSWAGRKDVYGKEEFNLTNRR
jgi:hypothetical protein